MYVRLDALVYIMSVFLMGYWIGRLEKKITRETFEKRISVLEQENKALNRAIGKEV